ncbi:MAG TPA: hypothetical protein VHL53_08990 [Acidimicrobiia bacterium]|nr:hypothetical protein [Acidimicrobiia bacterium]
MAEGLAAVAEGVGVGRDEASPAPAVGWPAVSRRASSMTATASVNVPATQLAYETPQAGVITRSGSPVATACRLTSRNSSSPSRSRPPCIRVAA